MAILLKWLPWVLVLFKFVLVTSENSVQILSSSSFVQHTVTLHHSRMIMWVLWSTPFVEIKVICGFWFPLHHILCLCSVNSVSYTVHCWKLCSMNCHYWPTDVNIQSVFLYIAGHLCTKNFSCGLISQSYVFVLCRYF